VMEYLLINHPLDCPVCDQAGECYLQDYSYRYGRAYSRFEETKVKNPKKDIGPHILLYSDRCIMCSRCVRFTREVTGTGELCVTGRGNREEIDVFPGKALDNELSGNVADICPVGALLDKDFLFEQRVWYLTSAPSIDGITASGDNIWVDHNQGRVWRLKPRTNMEVNKWWISDEIRYGWKFVHDENRLRTPSLRISGKTSECSWDVAYRELLAGLQGAVSRGQRLAAMLSPMLSCEDAFLLARAVREIDDQAILGIGPVPRFGQDKTFPGAYTIYAEKAPNARGVRRMLEHIAGAGAVLDYEDFLALLNNEDARGHNVGAVLLTGNYPSGWVTTRLAEALADRFAILIDTLPNNLIGRAHLVLPGATWVEKTGTFQNASNRLQGFEQAIAPLEGCKAEAQIGLDLLALVRGEQPQRYDKDEIHPQLDAGFTTDLHTPPKEAITEPDMAYVEF
jgi:NADH-quinone oxidoreductase subunit G